MKLNDKQKEQVKEVIKSTIDEVFESKYFQRKMYKSIMNALKNEQTTNQKINEEDRIVERYVKIAKPTDEAWMDLTSAALQSLLVRSFPELHTKMSTVKLGRALGKAGALKTTKNGINVYKIAKIKNKSEK